MKRSLKGKGRETSSPSTLNKSLKNSLSLQLPQQQSTSYSPLLIAKCRPLNAQEKREKSYVSVELLDSKTIRIQDPEERDAQQITVNVALGPDDDDSKTYQPVEHFLDALFDNFNCTIFAYGFTNTGKTYCIQYLASRFASEILNKIDQNAQNYQSADLSFSLLEIYNERIKDLLDLNSQPLRIFNYSVPQTTRVSLSNLSRNSVSSTILSSMQKRVTGSHALNTHSSRSHVFLTLHLSLTLKNSNATYIQQSSLTLVDLAGSERAGKLHQNSAIRMEEGNYINKSLSTLARVILALSTKTPPYPFRESKLTHLLQPTLTGRSLFSMILTLSPTSHMGAASAIAIAKSMAAFPSIKVRRNPVITDVGVNKMSLAIDELMAKASLMSTEIIKERENYKVEKENFESEKNRMTAQMERYREEVEKVGGVWSLVQQEYQRVVEENRLLQNRVEDLLAQSKIGNDNNSNNVNSTVPVWNSSHLDRMIIHHINQLPHTLTNITHTALAITNYRKRFVEVGGIEKLVHYLQPPQPNKDDHSNKSEWSGWICLLAAQAVSIVGDNSFARDKIRECGGLNFLIQMLIFDKNFTFDFDDHRVMACRAISQLIKDNVLNKLFVSENALFHLVEILKNSKTQRVQASALGIIADLLGGNTNTNSHHNFDTKKKLNSVGVLNILVDYLSSSDILVVLPAISAIGKLVIDDPKNQQILRKIFGLDILSSLLTRETPIVRETAAQTLLSCCLNSPENITYLKNHNKISWDEIHLPLLEAIARATLVELNMETQANNEITNDNNATFDDMICTYQGTPTFNYNGIVMRGIWGNKVGDPNDTNFRNNPQYHLWVKPDEKIVVILKKDSTPDIHIGLAIFRPSNPNLLDGSRGCLNFNVLKPLHITKNLSTNQVSISLKADNKPYIVIPFYTSNNTLRISNPTYFISFFGSGENSFQIDPYPSGLIGWNENNAINGKWDDISAAGRNDTFSNNPQYTITCTEDTTLNITIYAHPLNNETQKKQNSLATSLNSLPPLPTYFSSKTVNTKEAWFALDIYHPPSCSKRYVTFLSDHQVVPTRKGNIYVMQEISIRANETLVFIPSTLEAGVRGDFVVTIYSTSSLIQIQNVEGDMEWETAYKIRGEWAPNFDGGPKSFQNPCLYITPSHSTTPSQGTFNCVFILHEANENVSSVNNGNNNNNNNNNINNHINNNNNNVNNGKYSKDDIHMGIKIWQKQNTTTSARNLYEDAKINEQDFQLLFQTEYYYTIKTTLEVTLSSQSTHYITLHTSTPMQHSKFNLLVYSNANVTIGSVCGNNLVRNDYLISKSTGWWGKKSSSLPVIAWGTLEEAKNKMQVDKQESNNNIESSSNLTQLNLPPITLPSSSLPPLLTTNQQKKQENTPRKEKEKEKRKDKDFRPSTVHGEILERKKVWEIWKKTNNGLDTESQNSQTNKNYKRAQSAPPQPTLFSPTLPSFGEPLFDNTTQNNDNNNETNTTTTTQKKPKGKNMMKDNNTTSSKNGGRKQSACSIM